MNRIFSKISIGQRIALAIIIPLIGILILSAEVAYKDYNTYAKTGQLSEVVEVIAELSALTHALQEERGRTAGFIGSGRKGVTPQSILDAREAVDKEVVKYNEIAEHFKTIVHAQTVRDLAIIDREIASIPEFRKQVDSSSVDVGQTLGFYSHLIEKFFETSFHATEYSTDPKISLEILGMLNLGEAKEAAGKERGLINGAFAAGKLTLEQNRVYYGLIANQTRLKDNFINSEPEQYRDKYKKLMANSGIAELEELRKRVSKYKDNLGASGLTAREWYEKSTDRINNLRSIEEQAIDDIVKDTRKVSTESYNSMLFSSILSMSLVLIAVLIGWVVTRSITKPLSSLVSIMKRITQGDLEGDVPGQGQKSEIGAIADAVLIFKDNAIQKRQMQETQDADRAEQQEQQAERDAAKAKVDKETNRVVEILGQSMEKLAAGDLTGHIDEEFGQGLDGLRTSYNSALKQLADTVREIGTASEEMLSSSGEIQTAADNLAKRTEDQASVVSSTAAAVEETTAAMKTSSERTSEVNSLAATTRNNAEKSGEIVRKAVEAMGKIESSAEEITNIISVIDEISFQTNLLALNAGVEAARAGEAGQGFAVVATEVRELAQRSASAAKEIKTLITSSGEDVKAGAELVNEAGQALDNIVNEINEISTHVAAIADATNEQSTGLVEINEAVENIDQGTQQNAAVAEQSSAAARSLSGEADKIDGMLKVFTLTGSNAGPRPVAANQTSAASPVRTLTKKIAGAFTGGGAATAIKENNWEEF